MRDPKSETLLTIGLVLLVVFVIFMWDLYVEMPK